MSAHQARFRIATMARVLGVSTSGYHAWRQRRPSARVQADADLTVRVRAVHADSRGTYGSPRIHAELSAAGAAVSRKRVARVMRSAGIAGVSRRCGPRTTRRALRVRPAPDRVDRRFEAAAPNRLWVADVTCVPTRAGFLYLAVVVDVFSRRVVGWAMAGRLAHGAGDRGAGDGRAAAATGVGDPPFRPGAPVHVAGLRRPLSAMGRAAVDGFGRRLFRQRAGRELLRDARVRVARPHAVGDARRGADGRVRVHRRVVQHAAASFLAGLPLAAGLRTSPRDGACGRRRRRCCGNIGRA